VPCEKLIRATSIPAAASVSIRRAVAGPIVQISFVRRPASVSPARLIVGLYRALRDHVERSGRRERFHDSFTQISVTLPIVDLTS